jgi:hypothetical protein
LQKNRRKTGAEVSGEVNWCSEEGRWVLSIDAMELFQLPFFGRSAQAQELYYKRKMSMTPMGISDEGKEQAWIYFYDQRSGKTNSNHVISLLDRHIETHNPGFRKLTINMDNCTVNKNFFMVTYCFMLVESDYFEEVQLHWMIAGHTKFSPDRAFAWLHNDTSNMDILEPEDIMIAFRRGTQSSYFGSMLKHDDFGDWKSWAGDVGSKTIKGSDKWHRLRVRKSKAGNSVVEFKHYSS